MSNKLARRISPPANGDKFFVGQVVARSHIGSGWGHVRYTRDVVAKVYKNGNVVLESDLNQQWSNGYRTGDRRYHERMEPWTAAIDEAIARVAQQRETNSKVSDLLQALGGRKTGMGDYHLDAAQVALVEGLVAALKRE